MKKLAVFAIVICALLVMAACKPNAQDMPHGAWQSKDPAITFAVAPELRIRGADRYRGVYTVDGMEIDIVVFVHALHGSIDFIEVYVCDDGQITERRLYHGFYSFGDDGRLHVNERPESGWRTGADILIFELVADYDELREMLKESAADYEMIVNGADVREPVIFDVENAIEVLYKAFEEFRVKGVIDANTPFDSYVIITILEEAGIKGVIRAEYFRPVEYRRGFRLRIESEDKRVFEMTEPRLFGMPTWVYEVVDGQRVHFHTIRPRAVHGHVGG